ncbi:MAG: 4,5-DOPA dioxygenase extradiol [Spirochaetales bacterium]|nr:4,5-DOPA dioxygenase extradiol [Spirochaetales bacterium]
MKMPALFVGHGSPMNAIEDNPFTREWKRIGLSVKPKAILMISAHWFTKGTRIQDKEEPDVINDMYGFPRELYELDYRVRGSKELTDTIIQSLSVPVDIRNDWGLDHGAWSVLTHMYPHKDIPVVQISVNAQASPEDHFKLGRELKTLRDEGVFIIGSGNIVHNLRRMDFNLPRSGTEWANDFDLFAKDAIQNRDYGSVLNYTSQKETSALAVPTTDHLDPLFYILGASDSEDNITVLNEARIMGSLSMTSYLFD